MNTFNFWQQAELALASYGTLSIGTILPTSLTGNNVGMSVSQAAHFAENWLVVAPTFTDPSGASATLFQNKLTGEITLAIRGTEPSAADLTADGLLALGIPSSLNPQFTALKTQLDIWLADPNILQGQTFTVSGHSLGGYLAAAIKEQYSGQVTDAYLFNAPGVGGPLGNLADALTSAFGLNRTPNGNIWNIRSSEGFPVISGLGYQLGTSISIQTEGASNAFANHFIVPLTDVLAVQSLYAQLAPGLTQGQLNALVDASGATTNQTLESSLDALRIILLGQSTPQTVTGDRNDFYTNLYALEQSTACQGLAERATIIPLTGMTATDIAAMAGNNNVQGLAARYALQALNPFVLVGADYSAFNTDGALELYDPNTGTGALTEQYMADRTAMLERKIWFSTQDKNPVDHNVVFDSNNHAFQNESTYYEDITSGYKIAQGVSFPNTHHYFFGGNGDDTHTGAAVEDHLYGGAGNDTLQGRGGNDILLGGAGNDTYLYTNGGNNTDGFDTILDSDGNGRIIVDADQLAGGDQYGDSRVHRDDNGHLYIQNGSDLIIDGDILIKDYRSSSGDGMGLTMSGAAADVNPTITRDIAGDFGPMDFYDANGNLYYKYDDLNNLVTDPNKAEDRADTLNGSADNDHIMSGALNDTINATQGGDGLIETGSGRDKVYAGDGKSVLIGGTEGDILVGGAGDDRLYADTRIDAATAIAEGNTNASINAQGDWLNGGAGSDTLVGSDAQDVLMGGGGSDLLISGAGNDDILGDGNYVAQSFNWTVTDTNGNRLFQPVAGETDAANGGADVIYAGEGNDHAWGEGGNDVVFGERGDDIVPAAEAGMAKTTNGAECAVLLGRAKPEAANDSMLLAA